MPHQRKRYLMPILAKKVKYFPIVGLLGARQTGKSTLLRDLVSEIMPTRYVSMDRKEEKTKAIQSPSYYIQNLSQKQKQIVVIDEIQKAPDLFDTLKAEVDENRQPGRFLISGSVEFSKKTGIRESLTGRIGLTRLYPMLTGETAQLPLSKCCVNWIFSTIQHHPEKLTALQRWFDRGGMPGICFTRDTDERKNLIDSWVETTCFRDLQLFKIRNFDGEFAQEILVAVVELGFATLSEISKKVGCDPRKARPYLEAFQAIFVLYAIHPHSSGIGKTRYLFFDSGIAKHLGANSRSRKRIWLLNEIKGQNEYHGQSRTVVKYYRSPKGSEIDFIIESPSQKTAVSIVESEAPSAYEMRASKAFQERNPDYEVKILAPCLFLHKAGPRRQIVPWSFLI